MSQYKRYERYKDSGIELIENIPEHWDFKRLKYLARINPNKSEIRQTLPNAEVTFVPMEKIISTGVIDYSLTNTIENLIGGYTYFKDQDIIIAKVTPCFENGNIAIAEGLLNGIGFGTTELHVIRCKSDVSNRFLFYCFQSDEFKRKGVSEMYGVAGLKRIPTDFVLNYRIQLPKIIEQNQIAKFLDKKTSEIDSLIADKEKLIELLQEKRQAIISEVVTKGLNPDVKMKDSGIEWIGEIPEHWDKTFIKYIVDNKKDSIVDGPFGSSINVSTDYVDETEGVPIVRTVNINDDIFIEEDLKFLRFEKFYELTRHAVYPGDILFSKVGTIGNVCIFPSYLEKGILSTTGSCKISVNKEKVFNRFLVYMLLTMKKHFKMLASSNVQPFLNMTTIKNVALPLPDLNEQNIIVSYLDKKVDEQNSIISSIRVQVDKLKEYRQAIISEAVTGKIDVRNYETA